MALTAPPDDVYRLPKGPYPGLRPFLNHESQLLMGRERQVAQIIDKLDRTQFVAVVGGSGSGKSSLIRAGVVPELWGGGIPKAGKYWVPVICTPGTAPGGEGSGAGQGDGASTAITRLAWKLSQALRPCDSEQQAAARRIEMAEVFRQPGGFSRLVDLYSADLPGRGPDVNAARFLFVIDQFEEVFDPSNKPPVGARRSAPGSADQAHGSARWRDAERLVEAVIDHYFDPHPRCHVVLTMRSERLADCAGYLELPEAINTSMYLVRRLAPEEVQDAIIGPAKVYLRLLKREEEDNPDNGLPDDVVFDPPVIARLQADVDCIKDDPDHLPLLQHVLARCWEAACRAEGIGSDRVPARVTWQHLEHAAAAPGASDAAPRLPGWLHASTANTLTSSLESWAQCVYRHCQDRTERSAADRAQLDTLLRHLAYKDPNNGLYFQQRVGVNDPQLFDGVADPQPLLLALLLPGFLDSVNYLFWDLEDPQHVTLKVSHEAFIRGWPHFRALVDREAERFEEFVSLLKRCANWAAHGRSPGLLLASTELERLAARELAPVFAEGPEGEGWFRVLLLSSDGEKLAALRQAASDYIQRSRDKIDAVLEFDRLQVEGKRIAELAAGEARHRAEQAEAARALLEAEAQAAQAEAERAKAETARAESATAEAKAQTERAKAVAQRRRWGLFAGVVGVLAGLAGVVVFIFSATVYKPAMEEIAIYFKARTRLEYRTTSNNDPKALPQELAQLLEAARWVDGAKQLFTARGVEVRSRFEWFGPLRPVEKTVADADSEPAINAVLRKLLTSRVWPSSPVASVAGVAAPAARVDMPASGAQPAAAVDTAMGGVSKVDCPATGSAPRQYGVRIPMPAPKRDIVVRTTPTLDGSVGFFETSEQDTDPCSDTLTRFWVVPGELQPVLMITADLTRVAVVTPDPGQPSVAFYGIDWILRSGNRLSAQVIDPLSVAPGLAWVRLIGQGTKPDPMQRLQVLPVSPTLGGVSVVASGHGYRVFSETAVEIADGGQRDGWVGLPAASPGSPCKALEGRLLGRAPAETPAAPAQTGGPGNGGAQLLEDGRRCVDIQRGLPPGNPPPLPALPDSGSPKPAAVLQAQWVVANVYSMPPSGSTEAADTTALPPAVASINLGWLPNTAVSWQINRKKGSPYDGWIAVKTTAGKLLAAPWSTAALIRLGDEVLGPSQNFFASVDPPGQRAAAAPR